MEAKINKRIQKEFENFHKEKKKEGKTNGDTLKKIDVEIMENNFRYFKLKIIGPENTPYHNGIFEFIVYMPPKYPTSPPIVRMTTKIYHPNIDGQGKICLNILKDDNWSPTITLKTLALSLSGLLESPNLDDPLDVNVTKHFVDNPKEAFEKAKEWTLLYAK
jgi:ubiquitin-conjugating enzyme E2 N